jgi:hypothetical protein
MGWLMLLALAAAAFASLAWLRLSRLLWSMAGAALMLGATGYALQGRPMLSGSPARPDNRPMGIDPGLIELRTQMFGRYGMEGAYLTAADAVARSGAGSYEVQALLGGIRSSPKSAQLWTALGDALVRHDGGRLSAPARFAFDQAIRLDPRHPGPRFFLGLAQVRAEDFEGAEVSWRQALDRTSPKAGYRPAIAQRLALLGVLNRR